VREGVAAAIGQCRRDRYECEQDGNEPSGNYWAERGTELKTHRMLLSEWPPRRIRAAMVLVLSAVRQLVLNHLESPKLAIAIASS
jgi:hypothetical protein